MEHVRNDVFDAAENAHVGHGAQVGEGRVGGLAVRAGDVVAVEVLVPVAVGGGDGVVQ